MKKLREALDGAIGIPAAELEAITKRVNDVLLTVFGPIGGSGEGVSVEMSEDDLNSIHANYGVLWSLSEIRLWQGLVAVAFPESGDRLICLYYLRGQPPKDDETNLYNQDTLILTGPAWEDFEPHLIGWTSHVREHYLQAHPESAPERLAALQAAADAIWDAGEVL